YFWRTPFRLTVTTGCHCGAFGRSRVDLDHPQEHRLVGHGFILLGSARPATLRGRSATPPGRSPPAARSRTPPRRGTAACPAAGLRRRRRARTSSSLPPPHNRRRALAACRRGA